jgi:hypothetical protein
MIRKNHVFIANVMIIDLVWKIMISNVINQPIGAAMKLSAIAKIHKYERLHEGRAPLYSNSHKMCMVHFDMIWIVLPKNLLVFLKIAIEKLFIFVFLHSNF